MQIRKVYLAGPITGLSYGEARHGWREEFDSLMSQSHRHIECYSPMRAKNFLSKSKKIEGTADSYGKDSPFGQGAGILARDHNDVRECDAMVAYFSEATLGSLGTAAEFGFAHTMRKPIILIIENEERAARLTQQRTEKFVKDIRGALARAYCAEGNTSKVLDNTLLQAAEKELLALEGYGPILRNPHNHVFLTQMASYIVHDLATAVDVTASLLTPGI